MIKTIRLSRKGKTTETVKISEVEGREGRMNRAQRIFRQGKLLLYRILKC